MRISYWSSDVCSSDLLKTLLRYRDWQPTLDPNGVDSYLKLRYVPGPGGMFREVRKLPAAHFAIVANGRVTVERYWEPALYSGQFTEIRSASGRERRGLYVVISVVAGS